MTPAPISGPAAQRLARTELSRPEYARGGPSWPERVLDAIGRFLARLFGGGAGGGGTTAALLVVVGLVVLVLVVAAVRAGRWPGRTRRGPGAAGTDPLAPEPGVDHAARAEQALAAGDLAGAVREYLRDVVATLEHRGVLDPRPGRTGAAAARAGGEAVPAARAALDAAARAFDQVWFGERPATPDDVALARHAAAAVREAPVPAA